MRRTIIMTIAFVAMPVAMLFAQSPESAVDSVTNKASTTNTLRSEPFGLYMGMPMSEVAQLGTHEPNAPGVFTILETPSPHPDFISYLVVATEGQGVCRIVAVSNAISTSAYGDELKGKFNAIERALNQKYGPHERLDFLRPGSIWSEPRDWLMALRQKERVLMAYWNQGEKAAMPDDIEAIVLEANATSGETGRINLRYDFANTNECQEEMEAQTNSVF